MSMLSIDRLGDHIYLITRVKHHSNQVGVKEAVNELKDQLSFAWLKEDSTP